MNATSLERLLQKKVDLETRASRLQPEGLAEFVQLTERAHALQQTHPADAERLLKKAEALLPSVEKSVVRAIAMRDRIRAKMLGHAAEAMDEYSDVLRELAK